MSWSDKQLDWELNPHSLITLLAEAARGSMSEFSHYQIIRWLGRFADEVNANEETMRQLTNMCDDATVVWELFVSSHYTLEQLQKFSLNDVILPKEHFAQWHQKTMDLLT
jgi:hypothetical protein